MTISCYFIWLCVGVEQERENQTMFFEGWSDWWKYVVWAWVGVLSTLLKIFYISCISPLQIIWASHVINIIIRRDRNHQRVQISLPWRIIWHGLGASSVNHCTINICLLLLPHVWCDLQQQQQHLLQQSLLSCLAWHLQQCASCDRNAFNKAPPSKSPPEPQRLQHSMFSSVVCLFCLIGDWENKSHSFTNPLSLSP